MKRVILFLSLSLLVALPGFSQLNWAPIGAIWHYDAFEGCEGGCQTGYLTLEVVKDSIVGDTVLSKLEVIRYRKNGGERHHGFIYTFSKDSLVYYWENDTSYLMYDFTTKVGEAHKVYGWYDNENTSCEKGFVGQVRVDSLGHEELNGFDSKYYYTSRIDASAWSYSDKISTVYGCKDFLFAKEELCGISDILDFAGPLRCYEDSRVGLISYFEYECDQRILPHIQYSNNALSLINVFPNPTTDEITIDIPEYVFDVPNLLFTIVDIQGRSYLTTRIEKLCSALDLSMLKGGYYFLKIETDSPEDIAIFPIIKTQ